MSALAAPTVVSQSGQAATAVPMKGGLLLSPLPYGGEGGRRRKSKKSKKARKATKKALKLLKKFGGEELDAAVESVEMPEAEPEAPVGARRKSRKGGRKSRKGKKSRRHGFLY